MYALHIKNWFRHVPNGHHAVLRIEHLIHDERFWVIVAVAAIVLLLAFAMWVGVTNSNFTAPYPRYFPYGF